MNTFQPANIGVLASFRPRDPTLLSIAKLQCGTLAHADVVRKTLSHRALIVKTNLLEDNKSMWLASTMTSHYIPMLCLWAIDDQLYVES